MDVIDTSVLPGDDMDPDAIDLAAGKIRKVGPATSKTGASTQTAWHKISGVYHAPEQAELYSAMTPVQTQTEIFSTHLGLAATALETFAETVRTIKAAVVTIRSDVQKFEDKIGPDGKIQPTGGYNPYAGGMKLPIQWNEDTGMVAEHNRLTGAINTQIDAMRAAEIACANSIDDITGAAHVPTSGPGTPPAAPHMADAQWYLTAPIDRKEDCGQQIAHAVVIDFVGGAVSGVLGLVGVSFSLTTGKFANPWSTLKGSWGGLTKVVTALDPINLVLDRLPGSEDQAAEHKKTLEALGGSQISIDPFADDPKHMYNDQPYRAWTNTVLNVGSWLLPPLKALSAAKAGKAAELAADAAKAGDVAKAGEVARFGSAADLVKALRESGQLSDAARLEKLLAEAKISGRVDELSNFSSKFGDLDTPKITDYDLSTHPDTGTGTHPGPGSTHDGGTHGSGQQPSTTHAGDPAAGQHPATSDHPAGHEQPQHHQPTAHDGQPAHPQPTPDLAVKDPTEKHPISAADKPTYDADVATRKALSTEHTTDLRARNALAKDLRVDTKALTVDKAKGTLDDLADKHPDKLDEIDDLRDAVRKEQESRGKLFTASENLGVDAGNDYLKSHGSEVISGGERGRGRPGELDIIGLKPGEQPHLTVVEAKGAGSRLGFRMVDGVKTQQGTTAYLRDLLHKDPKFRAYLDANPEFAQKLARGEVGIDYRLVNARATGTVGVSKFKIDVSKLQLGDLDQAVRPGK